MTAADSTESNQWKIRRLIFSLVGGLFLGLAYILARMGSHGAFAGPTAFQIEVLFHREAVYIGGIRNPRDAGGVGYVFGSQLMEWDYLTTIGGANAHVDLLGFRFVTAPFLVFAIRLPWWLVTSAFVVLSGLFVATAPPKRPDTELHCECGYDLRATPERCPECGKAVTSQTRTKRVLDGQIGFWCAAIGASVTAADVAVGARGRVPDWAQLIWVLSIITAASLLSLDRCLRRRGTWQSRFGLLLLGIAVLRLFIPKLN